MKPSKFFNDDSSAVFLLEYPDGGSDKVTSVRAVGEVIEIYFPMNRGTGLKVGRIEREDADSISFTVADPQNEILNGVVTLTRTGEFWGERWPPGEWR